MHKLLGSQGRECQRSHWKVPDLALVMEIQQDGRDHIECVIYHLNLKRCS